MADEKTSVEIKWGKKDEVTFDVKAPTLKGAGDELNKREEWGRFEGHIDYASKTSKAKLVTEVTLKPWYIISMPSWLGYNNAPPKCQQEWNKMYRKLVDHEEGHRLVHQETLEKMEKYVEKAKDLTEKVLDAEFKKLIKEMQDNQKKFDSATGNGSKKGVELDIAKECE